MATPLVAVSQEAAERESPSHAGSETRPEFVTAEVTLAHVDVSAARSVLNELGYRLHVTSVHTNPHYMLLRGEKSVIDEVMTEVLPKIDVPGASGEHDPIQITYIPVKNRPSQSFMSLLHTAVPVGRDVNYTLDSDNRLLVVRAREEKVEEIRQFLEAMDRPQQPSEPLMLYVYFIHGQIAENDAEPVSHLPAELASVGRALQSNGLTELSLVGPVIVKTRDGEEFSAGSQYERTYRENRVAARTLELNGKTNLLDSGDLVQVQVEARVTDGWGTNFSVSTTLSTRLDVYTVLAASPAITGPGLGSRENEDGGVIAFALRVTRAAE